MKPKINLLPTDLGLNGETSKAVSLLGRISLLFGLIFIVLVALTASTILLTSFQGQKTTQTQKSLKDSIKNLEVAEQKLFLLKDRIAKIKTILDDKNAYVNMNIMSFTISNLPQEVKLENVEVDQTFAKITVSSSTSVGIFNFLNSITTNKAYSGIKLKDFSFNPQTGYLISLEIK